MEGQPRIRKVPTGEAICIDLPQTCLAYGGISSNFCDPSQLLEDLRRDRRIRLPYSGRLGSARRNRLGGFANRIR